MTDEKPFFTANDFRPIKTSDYPILERPTVEWAAMIANSKVAPLVEENARLRQVLRKVKTQELTRGYPTVTEWIQIIRVVSAALESK